MTLPGPYISLTHPPAKVAQTLARVKARIQDPAHWTQGELARNFKGQVAAPRAPTATCWCLVGAIGKELNTHYRNCLSSGERDVILDAIAQEQGYRVEIPQYNDTHSHAEVLNILDNAIKLAKELNL